MKGLQCGGGTLHNRHLANEPSIKQSLFHFSCDVGTVKTECPLSDVFLRQTHPNMFTTLDSAK
jgi:hypothetical protein